MFTEYLSEDSSNFPMFKQFGMFGGVNMSKPPRMRFGEIIAEERTSPLVFQGHLGLRWVKLVK